MSYEMSEDTTVEMLIYTVSVTDITNDTVTCSMTTATTDFYLQPGTNPNGMFDRNHTVDEFDVRFKTDLEILTPNIIYLFILMVIQCIKLKLVVCYTLIV